MSFEAKLRISDTDIDVVSFQWGASREQGSRNADVHDFTFVKHVDCASPGLFTRCCNGERFDQVVFAARRRGGEPDEVLQFTFTDVMIVSVRSHGSTSSDDMPHEEVALTFRKSRIDYRSGSETTRGGWPA